MENIFFYIIFVLPGYFSYLIVKTFKIGFGKKSDAFDKTVYSLLFDIPIFILTLLIFKNEFINKKMLSNTGEYIEFNKVIEFKVYFINDIDKLIILFLIISLISIIVGILWIVILWLTSKIYNYFSNHKIFIYSTVWDQCINKVGQSMPIEVYKIGYKQPVVRGFLVRNSASLDDDIELEVYNIELFDRCKKEKLVEEIERVYYNTDKEIKIIIYKNNKIEEYVNQNENKN